MHPAGLSYYNVLAGGMSGATQEGPSHEQLVMGEPPLFERTFWWEVITNEDWRQLQEHLPHGAKVWLFPDYVGTPRLKRWGVIRPDVSFVLHPQDSDFCLLYGRFGQLLDPRADPAGAVFCYEPAVWERKVGEVRMAILLSAEFAKQANAEGNE